MIPFAIQADAAAADRPGEAPLAGPVERYMAVDNVCAWPNLTVLRDGTIAATIFNRPTHGQTEGAVDVWASTDGRFWEKRGVAAPNEPDTNRMNVAAGLAGNGDLIVLSSGWSNVQVPGKPKQKPFRDANLSIVVCRSSDGGRNWSWSAKFPAPEKDWSVFIPFGDIFVGEDGALHAACYQGTRNEPAGQARQARVVHFRSEDDGRTWRPTSTITQSTLRPNETSILRLGGKKWLAAVRQEEPRAVYVFRSDDDGATWQGSQRLTEYAGLNGHLARLKDGRILFSYGNRADGKYGVLAKLSQDEGRTWSAPIRLLDSLARDCGYPSSVQRPDGAIVTAYYSASVQNHTGYHMGVIIWTPPARL